jgi:hypothetical protein
VKQNLHNLPRAPPSTEAKNREAYGSSAHELLASTLYERGPVDKGSAVTALDDLCCMLEPGKRWIPLSEQKILQRYTYSLDDVSQDTNLARLNMELGLNTCEPLEQFIEKV